MCALALAPTRSYAQDVPNAPEAPTAPTTASAPPPPAAPVPEGSAQAAAEVAHTESARRTRRILGYVFAGAGVAGGVATLFVARASSDKLDIVRHGGSVTANDITGAYDDGKSLHRTAIGVGIGSGALFAAGVVLFATSWGGRHEPTAPVVSFGPGGVRLQGTF